MKILSRLWLKNVKRAGRLQQKQGQKFIKALLAPPKPSAKPKRQARPGPVKKTRPTRVATSPASHRAPGRWLRSFISSFLVTGMLPDRRMHYWLYLPASAAPGMPLPLVVMLHGCEQTAEDFAQGTGMNRLAESQGFAVLYPQQAANAHAQRCWHWYRKSTQSGGDEAKLIAAAIERVMATYPIDRTRVYVAGLSAGASMANIVALHYPHLIAAVGMHSGTAFGAGHSSMGAYSVMQNGSLANGAIERILEGRNAYPLMPAILIHGAGDTVVRAVNQRHLVQQFAHLNQLPAHGGSASRVDAKGGTRPAYSYQVCDYHAGRRLVLRVYEIAQLGHAWSGGDARLRYNSAPGPDASRLMWDFFRKQRRDAADVVYHANSSHPQPLP